MVMIYKNVFEYFSIDVQTRRFDSAGMNMTSGLPVVRITTEHFSLIPCRFESLDLRPSLRLINVRGNDFVVGNLAENKLPVAFIANRV